MKMSKSALAEESSVFARLSMHGKVLEARRQTPRKMSPGTQVSFGIQVLAISLQVWASQLLNSDPGARPSTRGGGGNIMGARGA